jgi:beta-lactamase regulating signal transducer with metallopeptidase domain
MEKHLTVELMQVLLLIWLVGAMVFAGWHFYCYRRFSRQLRADSFPVPDDAGAALLSTCKAVLGIHGDVKLMLNPKITSPMLVGLRRPMILLPTLNMQEIDLKLVLTHELMHLKRKDLWVKMLALTAETLYWFNPFAHVLRKNISIWGELSCDEALATKMSHEERKLYGEAILNTLDNHSGMNTAFCSALCEGKKHIERRLTMLLNVKKMKKYITVFAVVAIVAIASISIAVAALAAEYNPDKFVPNGQVSWVAYDDERGAGKSEDSETEGDSIINTPQNIVEYDLAGNNQVLCFDTQEELDAHLKILAERRANGLDPYEGFEELYANVDFNYPIAYTVCGLVPVCPAN